MHFVVQYRDRPGTREKRKQHHPSHIQFRKELGSAVLLSGPLLSPDTDETAGSLLVLDAPDLAAASEIAGRDPMVVNQVLELVSVTPFRLMALNPPAATIAR